MPYLTRENGDLIFYDITGKPGNTPIITLHGYLENGEYWSRTGISAGLAAAGFCVYDMDMRGHGRSVPSAQTPDYSMDALISDIGALADHLGLAKFHLMGHATGGIICARYAIRHSDRLISFMSSDSASMSLVADTYTDPEWDEKPIPSCEYCPGEYSAQALSAFGSLENYVAEARKAAPDNMFSQFYRTYSNNSDPERCWRWTRDIHCVNILENRIAFARGFGNNDPDPCARGLRTISCPCLLWVGAEDHIMIKPMEVLARNIPDNEFVKMDGISHMTTIEAPDETLELILRFLQKRFIG